MSLMQMEKQRQAILASAKLGDGFYNVIGGKRLAATRHLAGINPATGKTLATVPDIDAATPTRIRALARSWGRRGLKNFAMSR
jgi:hypothetical protein